VIPSGPNHSGCISAAGQPLITLAEEPPGQTTCIVTKEGSTVVFSTDALFDLFGKASLRAQSTFASSGLTLAEHLFGSSP